MNRKVTSDFRSVVVYLEFDNDLQTLTGVSRTSIEVTEGTPFFMLLQAVLDSYPAIVSHHELSSIGFSVNGYRPNPQATLTAHDIVYLGIHQKGKHDESEEYYH